ncbi:unnamed protein product [Soboliphyme baturini]|uniref:Transposase n=1 Tax=Soboliphyme baturini TaxID=241478 RepID=A0A183JB43_9BILA|nr:unnamed protein product [Soboliphyme baturini]
MMVWVLLSKFAMREIARYRQSFSIQKTAVRSQFGACRLRSADFKAGALWSRFIGPRPRDLVVHALLAMATQKTPSPPSLPHGGKTCF